LLRKIRRVARMNLQNALGKVLLPPYQLGEKVYWWNGTIWKIVMIYSRHHNGYYTILDLETNLGHTASPTKLRHVQPLVPNP
jgi:hypothetical protein